MSTILIDRQSYQPLVSSLFPSEVSWQHPRKSVSLPYPAEVAVLCNRVLNSGRQWHHVGILRLGIIMSGCESHFHYFLAMLPWLILSFLCLHFLRGKVNVLGNSSPQIFHVSAHLASWGTGCLCCVLPFQGCLYSEKPWKIDTCETKNWVP